jgi:ribosomal protein S7
VKSLEGLYLSSFDAKRVRINKKVQEFYEVLEKEVKRTEEEAENRAIELLPEAYVETIPLVEATLVEAIPVAIPVPVPIGSDLTLEEYTE